MDLDLNNLVLPRALPTLDDTQCLLMRYNSFTGKRFFTYLNALYRAHGGYVNVCTYTASDALILDCPVNKLLYTSGGYAKAKKSRQVANLHTKLYLFYTQTKRLCATFVGSQNLVAPTNYLDIMVLVHDCSLEDYFERLWKQAK